MSELNYNGNIVNHYTSNLSSISNEFNSVSTSIKRATNQIVSAKGFNEYIGGITSDTFCGYVNECQTAVSTLVQMIRQTQVQILSYSQDKSEIDLFLNTLSRTDYDKLDLSGIESNISFGRKALNFLGGISSSIFAFGAGLVEGVLDFAETGADLVVLGGTAISSIFTASYDAIYGTDTTKKMWEETKAYVSDKKVENIFNSFYDNTSFGQTIKNNAYGFEMSRGVGKGVGYTAALIGTTVLTGGLASGAGVGAAGSVGVGQLTATAGLMGFSNGTEEAWADGATVGKGLLYGAASGGWEAAQWYVGAKINQFGGVGDQIAENILKNTAKSAGIRVALDTVDSAAEGFVQPALKMIYKDYGGDNFIDNYKASFNEAGGWNNVKMQAMIGGIGSAVSEVIDARRILKSNDKVNADASKTKFDTSGEKIDTDSQFNYKAMTDDEIRASQDKLGFNAKNADADSQFRTMTGDGAGGVHTQKVDTDSQFNYKAMTDDEIRASQDKLGFNAKNADADSQFRTMTGDGAGGTRTQRVDADLDSQFKTVSDSVIDGTRTQRVDADLDSQFKTVSDGVFGSTHTQRVDADLDSQFKTVSDGVVDGAHTQRVDVDDSGAEKIFESSNTQKVNQVSHHKIDSTPLKADENVFQIAQQINPDAKAYSWDEFVNATAEQRKKWEAQLKATTYIDSKTGKKFSLEDVVYGYIHENVNEPGSYSLLNTVNRAKGANAKETIQNLLSKDAAGNFIKDGQGNYVIEIKNFMSSDKFSYDPITNQVFSQSNPTRGLNVDYSIGTINDLLTRVDSETKALSDALSGMSFDEQLILRRGTDFNALRNYGVSATDSAEEIYKKLTTNHDVFVDNGFMSTSPDKYGGFGGQVQFVITTKKGATYGNFGSYNPYEKEVLLNYGSSFNVSGVKKDINGIVNIFLEQI